MEFIILLALAVIPAKIAQSKGRNFWTWYIYGVLLFIVALIHALVMKSNYVCSYCKSSIDKDATVCPHCAREVQMSSVNTF